MKSTAKKFTDHQSDTSDLLASVHAAQDEVRAVKTELAATNERLVELRGKIKTINRDIEAQDLVRERVLTALVDGKITTEQFDTQIAACAEASTQRDSLARAAEMLTDSITAIKARIESAKQSQASAEERYFMAVAEAKRDAILPLLTEAVCYHFLAHRSSIQWGTQSPEFAFITAVNNVLPQVFRRDHLNTACERLRAGVLK